MKEWQIRQQYYYSQNPDPGDLFFTDEKLAALEGQSVTVDNVGRALDDADFEAEIISYFTVSWNEWIHQPQKSFAVALVYAKLLEKYFGEDFYVTLDTPNLLLGDPFFRSLSEARGCYQSLIDTLTAHELWDFEDNPLSQVQATVTYFKKEFLLV